ncbi:MAG TPA: UTP--glucose-1-phosphate uridylyltransferase [Planctomycetaceae bacterium]|nr:UTP--glucose-1-phosphate uridylyltransferase [Planctomycetaceae bacterium]HIQ23128.1 UTP--glucose-1-phosphate uridylyltransferase [Planctomycetota bacterium]
MTDIAVVPVAGRGTRLLPLTKSQPKEMLPVGRKPVVQYVVEELARCGIHRLLFVTGPGKTAIENHFDIDVELITHLRLAGKEELLSELAFEREDLEYFYTRQRRQLGLGHAILCAEPVVGQMPFVVALGDSIIGRHAASQVVRRMIDVFCSEGVKAVVAFEEVPREEVVQYGIAQPKDGASDVFELADVIEKPEVDEAPSNLAVAARYVFSPVIFDYLRKTAPGKGDEIQLTDAMRAMIRGGHRTLGIRLPPGEKRFDIGNFESYFEAFVEFVLADPAVSESLKQRCRQLLEVAWGARR